MTDSGWRFSEPYGFEKNKDKREAIVKELLAMPRPPARDIPKEWNGKPLNELTEKEKEEFYFSMQPPSTQAALLAQKKRNPDDDLEWLLRPIPECIANPNAKNKDELVAKRNVGIEEFTLVEGMRRAQRNTVGESKAASVDSEMRSRAVHAFTYSEPANPSISDLKRLKRLSEFEAVPVEQVVEKIVMEKVSVWERFRLWFNKKFGDTWIYK